MVKWWWWWQITQSGLHLSHYVFFYYYILRQSRKTACEQWMTCRKTHPLILPQNQPTNKPLPFLNYWDKWLHVLGEKNGPLFVNNLHSGGHMLLVNFMRATSIKQQERPQWRLNQQLKEGGPSGIEAIGAQRLKMPARTRDHSKTLWCPPGPRPVPCRGPQGCRRPSRRRDTDLL